MRQRAILGSITMVILTACQPSGIPSTETGSQDPMTTSQIVELVTDTDQQICGLDLSGLDEEEVLEDAPIGELADFRTYAHDTQASFGEPLRQVYRRAALSRRLQAGTVASAGQEDVAKLADDLYARLDDEVPNPKVLSEYLAKTAYWDAQVAELNAVRDTQQAQTLEYNVHFCIVNERGGAARAAARAYLLENDEGDLDLADDQVFEFLRDQEYFTKGFKTELLKALAEPSALEPLHLARLALLRDGETALLPTDPKTAEAFWAARDMEIEAGLDYLDNTVFETPAAELYAMTRLDQSLRFLVPALEDDKSHFLNEKEAELAFVGDNTNAPDGLGKRLIRIDTRNTERVKQMLEGRDWFQDDLDGEGAGYYGWLLVQHADRNPEFQVEVLGMIEAKIGAPGVSKGSFAYLYDRVAVAAGRPQRYGTQSIECVAGHASPGPLEDAENIDALRAELGLGPLAEYMAIFGECDG